jgi:hypothetical protein
MKRLDWEVKCYEAKIVAIGLVRVRQFVDLSERAVIASRSDE